MLHVGDQTTEGAQPLGVGSIDAVLGRRVRHLRKARGLSLKLVAERSGISIGLLSQIERGRSSASVRVLASLSDSLQVGLSSLFAEETRVDTPEVGLIVRRSHRKQLSFWRTGISKELLTPNSDDSRLAMFLVLVEPGGTTGTQLYSHEGEEAGFVLEGSVVVNVEGHEYVLESGDSFRFASTRRHSFRNDGDSAAKVVWVNARPAEKGAR
jgi:transcriptional regulator with XRE-family HTH domain